MTDHPIVTIEAGAEKVIIDRATELGLDPDRILDAILSDSVLARVALYGEDGGWPAAHVAAARRTFARS